MSSKNKTKKGSVTIITSSRDPRNNNTIVPTASTIDAPKEVIKEEKKISFSSKDFPTLGVKSKNRNTSQVGSWATKMSSKVQTPSPKMRPSTKSSHKSKPLPNFSDCSLNTVNGMGFNEWLSLNESTLYSSYARDANESKTSFESYASSIYEMESQVSFSNTVREYQDCDYNDRYDDRYDDDYIDYEEYGDDCDDYN